MQHLCLKCSYKTEKTNTEKTIIANYKGLCLALDKHAKELNVTILAITKLRVYCCEKTG